VNPFAAAPPSQRYAMAEREVQARVFGVGDKVGARAFIVQRGGTAEGEFYMSGDAGVEHGGALRAVPWVPGRIRKMQRR
jgi:hypothetical protein